MAQRYYYRAAQLPLPSPSSERTYTWQHAYDQRHGNWLGALQVLRNLRDLRRALASLRDELSSDEEAEEEEPETDAEMEVEEAAPDAALALQQEIERSALQPSAGAPSPAWFTGGVHRLG